MGKVYNYTSWSLKTESDEEVYQWTEGQRDLTGWKRCQKRKYEGCWTLETNIHLGSTLTPSAEIIPFSQKNSFFHNEYNMSRINKTQQLYAVVWSGKTTQRDFSEACRTQHWTFPFLSLSQVIWTRWITQVTLSFSLHSKDACSSFKWMINL